MGNINGNINGNIEGNIEVNKEVNKDERSVISKNKNGRHKEYVCRF
jgi:hypothetical protein